MNGYSFQIGQRIQDARHGECVVVGRDYTAIKLRTPDGLEIDFQLPSDQPVTQAALRQLDPDTAARKAEAKAAQAVAREAVRQAKAEAKASKAAARAADRAARTVRKGFDDRLATPSVLGFLAMHAGLLAEVRPEKQDAFFDRYNVSNEDDSNCLFVRDNRWGANLRVRIQATREQMAALGIDDLVGDTIRICMDDNPNSPPVFDISNNRYFWFLHDIGFRLGRRHDLDSIGRHTQTTQPVEPAATQPDGTNLEVA